MQGRLSPVIGGRIQAFPWKSWREEFPLAAAGGFHLMEWTLDQDRLRENPLVTPAGRSEIGELRRRFGVRVASVTGDCFMQAPFWRTHVAAKEDLQNDFRSVVEACTAAGISIVVIPLVDGGKIENTGEEDALLSFLDGEAAALEKAALRIAFESDFSPVELARFIGRFDCERFGINYDIGNSAALAFDPSEEMAAYGHRVINVHVKDRLLRGTTVSLGTGAADFEAAFDALARVRYRGNYILQTARADEDHVGVLRAYRDMTAQWARHHAA